MSQDREMSGPLFFGQANGRVWPVFSHDYKVILFLSWSIVLEWLCQMLTLCEIVDVQQENHQFRATPKPKWYSTRPGPRCHGLLFFFSLCSSIYVAREFRQAANPVKGCKNRKQNPYGSWVLCSKLKKKNGRPVALGDPETFWMCFIFVIFLKPLDLSP